MSAPVPARALDPELILQHDPFVRGLARRLLRDAHAAEDVAQQTWLAACTRSIAPASLRDWLGAVARRMAGKRARAERRELARQQAAARTEQVPSTAALVAREALRAEIVRAVLELAEPYRTVVLLRWFDGLPPRAIARRLQVPVETVRTRHKRALAELRVRLDRHAGGDRAAWTALLVGLARRKKCVALGTAAAPGFLAGVMLMTLPVRLSIAGLVLAGVFACALWFGFGGPADPPQETPLDGTPPASLTVASEPELAESAVPEPQGAASGERTRVADATPTTGSVLVRVRLHDGTPASGVEVELSRTGAIDDMERRRGVTDTKGELRFPEEPPGRTAAMVLRPDMTASARCEVVAGSETVVELAMTRGIDVMGIVVDGRGAPIAGADIVAANWSGQTVHRLGESAADGTFALRSVSTHGHVGARAPGFCASSMHTITAGEGAAVELRLVLSKPAATVSGMVFGPDGEPVADALVRVGSQEQDNHKLPDGATAMAPRPVAVRTDHDGRFVATGLPAGKLPCAVRARDLAPWEETVQVDAGERRELTVRLQAGVTLSGVARTEQGDPVAGAHVMVGDWRTLGLQRRRTDAGGAFTFTGLPVGEVKVRAAHDQRGKAETTLSGRAGEHLRWDPVLSAGIVLRGRVVDEHDAPVAKVILEARAESGQEARDHWSAHGWSGDDGRFQLENCPPGTALQIDVRRYSMRELRLREIVPGSDELVVRLPSVALVRIEGVAVGPDGNGLTNVEVHVLHAQAGGDLETLDPATGAFDLGPYVPGEISLRLSAAGFAPIRLRRTVEAGEVWDVGQVAFARGGTLALELEAEARDLVAKRHAVVFDDQGFFVGSIAVQAGRATGGPWAAGDYVLQLSGEGLASMRHAFTIRVDATTKVALRVHGGVPTEITLELPAGVQPDGVPLEVIGSGGEVVQCASARRRPGGWLLRTALRPGRYTARAVDDLLAGEATFEVAAPGPARPALVLRTR